MKLKLCLLLVFIITYSWSQSGSTKTFTGNGTFPVPAGVTSIQVQAWGGGGSGGGASGAPLLLGRGAAGGGGGAYASNTLLVTPGATLNVVVASQTSGTTGAGTAGGNSTITGFESAILAAGGSGGDANNAGGSPVGGSGGTTAASAGSVKFAGANGGNGNSWNLLGLLLSSGAGGAGASSGGAGGTAVSGILFSNAPGNAGSPPGGAGSGAINSALGASQIGGAGAAGRVIISYSCANFSLTSTSATGVCASAGTTSTVTLTGSAASLPVGNYVVTYNRSSPSATALTANLTVSTAGTGTFTAVGLTTAGSSTITVTKLESESCSSTITTNNTATITVSPASVGGTVSGGTTVCSGNTSGVLTLSGNTGTVVKWQSSVSPFSTWTDIANTNTTYTSGALTATTQFRAVVQSGVCAAVNSAGTTVTVSPTSVGGTVSGGTSICSGSTSGVLTLSGNTGTVVKWQSSVSPFSTWTDIANTNTTYTSGALTETTQFRAVVQSGACAAVNSGATTVTVSPSPTIAVNASAQNACLLDSGESTPLFYSGTTGSPVTYSIVWNSSPANSFVPVTDAALSSGAITVLVPAGTAVGIYTGTVTVKNAAGCVSSGSVFTVNVNNSPGITTTGTIASVCTSTNSQNATLAYSAAIGSPTRYSIDWNATANAALLADQDVTPFTFVPSGGSINTIVIPANVPGGTYSGIMTIANETCLKYQPVSITVLPATVGGTVSGGTSVCRGSTSGLLTLSGHSGTIIKWQSSVSPFSTWSDIANTTTTYTSGILTETFQFRAVVQNGICDPVNSAATTVTVSPIPDINLSASAQPVCVSDDAQTTTLSYSATTGSPTTYSIVWSSSPENSFEAVTDAALSGSNITISVPAETAVGTYTGTLTVKNEDGCVSSGSTFTVTVNDNPDIATFGVMNSVCTSTNSQVGLLEYNGTSGNPTSYAIDWDSAANAALLADQPNTPFAFPESGNIDTIVIPANVPGGSYHGILTLSNGSCFSTRAINLTVSPTTVGGTVSGGTTICSGNPSGELTLSDYTGSVINWQSSVSPFTTWTDIENTEPTYTSEALTETTQFRAVIQSGECSVVNSASTTVTVSPSPTILLPQPFYRCSYNDSLYFTIPATTTGSPVTYSIVWDGSASTVFDTVTDEALLEGSVFIDNVFSPPTGIYTGTITVKNEAGCESPGLSFSINVIAPPTITSTGTIDSVCTSTTVDQNANLSYSATTDSPTSYDINWNSDLLTNQSSTPFAFASGGGVINTIQIPANTPPGTYSGTLTVTNANCHKKLPISLTISPATVGGTVTGGTTISSGSTSGLLTLSGHTGSVVKWQSSVSPFTTWVDITNTNTTYTSGSLTETTQFRAVVQSGTCDPVYSEPTTVTVEDLPTIITSGSAENVCSNSYDDFSTSLFYSATTGSPVTYSIVWNSSPANTLVAVTDAVLPASPITINIPMETAGGTYTGTITVKDANGISSLGSTFTVTINETPSISLYIAFDTICTSTNAQNASIYYANTLGSPTSYSINWDSTANAALLIDQPSTPFAFSPSGGTFNTIVIPANVPAGVYSADLTISNESCSVTYSDVHITILPATVGGTVTGGTTIGTGSTSGLLTLSGHTGSVLKWQSSVSPFATWTDIANANTTYTSGALTETTQFRAVVRSGVCDIVNSEATTVTVEALPTITALRVNNLCSDGSAQQTSLFYYEETGSPVTYSIAWNPSPANSFLAVTDAVLPANPILIDVPANTAPETYTGTLTVKTANGTTSQGYAISFRVIAIPSITTSGTITSVCASPNVQYASLSYTNPVGNPKSYIIDWDDTGDGLAFQGATAFTFETSPGVINTIEIPANTLPGTYSGILVFTTGECEGSHPVSITISPATVGGTVTGGTTISSGSTSGLLTLSGHTGSVVKWQSSVSPFTTWADIANTTTTYTSGSLTQTTQFRAVVQNGTCSIENSEATTVTVVPPTIELDSSENFVCVNEELGGIGTLQYIATTGNPVTYSIVWDPSPANNIVAVTDASLPASPIAVALPAGTDAGIYTGILTVKNAAGISSSGSTFEINVGIAPTLSSTGIIDPVSTSTNVQYTTLAYSGVTNNPEYYDIDWDSNDFADQSPTSFAFSPGGGTIDNIEIPANVPAGNYSGIIKVYGSSCYVIYRVSITINAAAPTISIATSANDVCSDGNIVSTPLYYKGTTGSPVTYSIVWNTSPTNSFVAITDAALPPNPFKIVIPAGTAAGTYTGTLTVKDANGISSLGKIFTVNVNEVPEISLALDAESVCTSTSLQNTKVYYRYGTGNPTSYSINWNQEANDALLQDQDNTPNVFDEVEGYIETIQISANAQPGTYFGTLVIYNESCSEALEISITINPLPTAPVIVNVKQPTAEFPTGSVLLSGLPSDGDNWTIETNPATTTRSGSDESAGISGLEPGTYTFTVTNTTTGCSSEPSASVVINEVPLSRELPQSITSPGTTDLKSLKNPITVSALNKVINVETPNQIIEKVYIFDVSGNLIYEKVGVSDPKLVITDLRSTNQVLVVKVILNNNHSEIRKVIF